jgi:RNA polymerase sigma factor (sigma-70 family)
MIAHVASPADLVAEIAPWIDREARRYARIFRVPDEFEDLASEGRLAALLAAQRFDPMRGSAFGAFARHHVHARLLSHAIEQRHVRVPTRSSRKSVATAVLANYPVSLDVCGDGLLHDHAANPEQLLLVAERDAAVARAIAALDPRTRRVLQARFSAGQKLDEVGRSMQLSRSGVSRIAALGIAKIRRRLGLRSRGANANV